MYILALGLGQTIAKLEKALIRRLSAMPTLANRGSGGENAKRGEKTFLYMVTSDAASES